MDRRQRKEANLADKQEAKQKRASNKEFARVTYLFVILFLGLMSYIVYFQIVRSKEWVQNPYNARQDNRGKKVVRGKILDREGQILAQTLVNSEGKEYREYPYGNLYAHVVGYSQQGKYGLEAAENNTLFSANEFFLKKIKDDFEGKKYQGDTLVTTLDTSLQQAAYQAMGNYKGAVVILRSSTGEIMAMVSKPDFNPNEIKERWDALNQDSNSALLNRSTQGKYSPGSTFKVVSQLAYMRENPDFLNYGYQCPGYIDYNGTVIYCYNHQAHGYVNLQQSLAYSCNASFSNIGISLDVSGFQDTSKQLLFGKKISCPLPTTKSSFDLKESSNVAEKMMTAMGQGKTQVSPYHMALITCGIANQGVIMKPTLVYQKQNASGTVLEKFKPKEYKRIMTPEEAEVLKKDMEAVTTYGTASLFWGSGYSVAGKTGTAEYGEGNQKTHSWFIGMTNVESPDFVIGIVIEDSDGNASAAMMAKRIFDVYYNQ